MSNASTKSLLALLILTFVVRIQTGWCAVDSASPDAQFKIDKLVESVERNAVDVVEILYMNERTETFSGMSPNRLEKAFDYKIVLRGNDAVRVVNALPLKGTAVTHISKMPNVRLGILFYGHSAHRVCSIYFDKFGDGVVDAIPVTFNSQGRALSDWLRTSFSQCLNYAQLRPTSSRARSRIDKNSGNLVRGKLEAHEITTIRIASWREKGILAKNGVESLPDCELVLNHIQWTEVERELLQMADWEKMADAREKALTWQIAFSGDDSLIGVFSFNANGEGLADRESAYFGRTFVNWVKSEISCLQIQEN